MNSNMTSQIESIKRVIDALHAEQQRGTEVYEAHAFLSRSENTPNGVMVAQIISHRMMIDDTNGCITVTLGDKIIAEGCTSHKDAELYGKTYIGQRGYYLDRDAAKRAATQLAIDFTREGMAEPMCL